MWLDPDMDKDNIEWDEACAERLRPFTRGSYISETDFVRRPAWTVEAYRPQCWRGLADLRTMHDPHRLFFDLFEGLGEDPSPAGS